MGSETFLFDFKPIDPASPHIDSIFRDLLTHQAEEILACNTSRVTRVIVRPWNKGCPAFAGVDDARLKVEARQINSCRQASGTCANDEAIEHRLCPL